MKQKLFSIFFALALLLPAGMVQAATVTVTVRVVTIGGTNGGSVSGTYYRNNSSTSNYGPVTSSQNISHYKSTSGSGKTFTMNATANSGFRFVCYMDGSGNEYTGTSKSGGVKANTTYTAYFIKDPYTFDWATQMLACECKDANVATNTDMWKVQMSIDGTVNTPILQLMIPTPHGGYNYGSVYGPAPGTYTGATGTDYASYSGSKWVANSTYSCFFAPVDMNHAYTFASGQVIIAQGDGGYPYIRVNGVLTNNNAYFSINVVCGEEYHAPGTITAVASPAAGGSVTVSPSGQQPANTNVTLTPSANTGYNFSGWADGGNSNPRVVSVNGDANYTANFSLINYSITYNLNGGSGTSNSTYNITSATVTLPTAPTVNRTGYTFGGWYNNSGLTGDAVTTIPTGSTGNKSFWAKWTAKTYTVNLNNQSATTAGQTSVTATYDAAMPSIAGNLPTKTGASFQGYYSGTNGSGTKYYNADGTSARNWNINTDPTTLYAYWWNAGEITATASPAAGGTTTVCPSGSQPGGTDVAIQAIPNTGYHFVQWNDGNTDNPRTVYTNGNVTYTATFEQLNNGYDYEYHFNYATDFYSPLCGQTASGNGYIVSRVQILRDVANTLAAGYPAIQLDFILSNSSGNSKPKYKNYGDGVYFPAPGTYTSLTNTVSSSYTGYLVNNNTTISTNSGTGAWTKWYDENGTSYFFSTIEVIVDAGLDSHPFFAIKGTLTNGKTVYATIGALSGDAGGNFSNLGTFTWANTTLDKSGSTITLLSQSTNGTMSAGGYTFNLTEKIQLAFMGITTSYIPTGTAYKINPSEEFGSVRANFEETDDPSRSYVYRYGNNASYGQIWYYWFLNQGTIQVLNPNCSKPMYLETVGTKSDPRYNVSATIGSIPALRSLTVSTSGASGSVCITSAEGHGYPIGGFTAGNSGNYYYDGTNVSLDAPNISGYNFVNWTKGGSVVSTSQSYAFSVSSSNSGAYVANYEPDAAPSTYTVTWKSEDGNTTLETDAGIASGGSASFNGEDNPTKTSDAEWDYTFDGWSSTVGGNKTVNKDASVTVTQDQDYYAYFSKTKRYYNITFKNEDGTTLKKLDGTTNAVYSVAYGSLPAYDGATPTKAATAQYTYTFNGWDKTIVAVTGETTYTATYSSTTNEYAIRFLNYDGTVLQNSDVAYGETPSYSGTPTKTATGYTYTFTGWDPTIGPVTGVQDYTATFSETPNTNTAYTVKHYKQNLALDGYSLEETDNLTGTTAAPTAAVAKTYTGFTSQAFEQGTIAANGTTVVSIYYNRNLYTVTWKNGETTLETDENVPYGATPSYDGSDPTKTATAQYTYTFDGWATEANGEKVYNIGATPTVSGAATYYAHFSAATNTYTVSIVSNNAEYGTVSPASVASVPYGTTITTSTNTINVNGTPVTATPAAATAQYTYGFSGWTNGAATVTGAMTITANFTRTVNTYDITWKSEDGTSTLETDAAQAFGTTTAYNGAVPTKSATGYTYTFDGWATSANGEKAYNNGETPAVSGAATYYAHFTGTANTHTLAWDANGGTLTGGTAAGTTAYGTALEAPTATREGYTFNGWSPSVPATMPDDDATYTAQWNRTEYTITYEGLEGATNTNPTSYNIESETITLAAPGERSGYAFIGWTCGGNPITQITLGSTGDKTITANWSTNTHNVSWVTDGNALTGTYTNGTTAYGTTIVAPATPTKNATAQYTYTFNGWSPAVDATMPDNDVEYTATWTQTPVNYTLTWTTDGDALTGDYTHGTVAYGTTIVAPATPTKTGYTFAGWTPTPAATMPAANTEYTATWTAITYTITYNGGANGTGSVAAGVKTYGVDFTLSSSTFTREGYTQTGWSTSDGGAKAYELGGTYTGNAALTLYPYWETMLETVELLDNENTAYYTTFKTNYNGEKVNAKYTRTFGQGRWSTLCLPFNVTSGQMTALKMKGRVYEFNHAEGDANIGDEVILYFAAAKSLEAGKCYIVNANNALAGMSSFTFSSVTINLDADNVADLTVAGAYDNLPGYKQSGNIELIGTLRKGMLTGSLVGHTYMGLKDNKIYYPNTSTGSTVLAYRGVFRIVSSSAVMERMRIVVDGEDAGELEVVNGELQAVPEARKFIRDGVLYIEREGVIYDAAGQRVE